MVYDKRRYIPIDTHFPGDFSNPVSSFEILEERLIQWQMKKGSINNPICPDEHEISNISNTNSNTDIKLNSVILISIIIIIIYYSLLLYLSNYIYQKFFEELKIPINQILEKIDSITADCNQQVNDYNSKSVLIVVIYYYHYYYYYYYYYISNFK